MSLTRALEERIALDGPITVAEYMTACLHDPAHGYYATRPHLGAEGDFITAPMVSQMFGELLGLWVAQLWLGLGRPRRFRLIEVGPGDATLMRDMLRALRVAPEALDAADLWLVEPSGPLRAVQEAALAGQVVARWAASLSEVTGGAPMILIANEVLDCMPARQFVRMETGWAERLVGLDAQGSLAFGLTAAPGWLEPPANLGSAAAGSVLEVSTAQEAFGAALGARAAADGGVALLIDYGRDQLECGDTLQALKSHCKVPPLETPGESDLTMHADFASVADAARQKGAATSRIVGQGAFLRTLGIETRAAALARARPDRAAEIGRQLARLIEPEQMGVLFKALAISQAGVRVPGFDQP